MNARCNFHDKGSSALIFCLMLISKTAKSNTHKYLNKLFYLLFGIFMFCGISAWGQSSPGEFNNQIHTEINDYYLKVYWGTDLPWYNDDDDHAALEIKNASGYPAWNYYYQAVNKNDGNSNYPAGQSITNYGPNRSYRLEIFYQWGRNCNGCHLKWGTNYREGVSPKLKAPTNVSLQTTVVAGINYPSKLIWAKGTSVPDNLLDYYIYLKKGNGSFELIATVAGDKREFAIDYANMESGDYVYSVQTVLNDSAPSDWNKNKDQDYEAPTTAPSFNLLNKGLTASSAENGKIKLAWASFNGILGLDAIVIYKRITGTAQDTEVATVTKASKTYSDLDIIPGKRYTYYLKLVPDNSGTNTAKINSYKSSESTGYANPNGKLSGYVKSLTGVGIANTTLTAVSKNLLNDGATNNTRTYTATTDATGYYEITDVYYDASADYVVTPKLLTYTNRHDPANITRKLTLDEYNVKNINFTDTASFTVKGLVYFPLVDKNNAKFKVEADSVDVYVDGIKKTTTNQGGEYNVSFPVQGVHHIAAVYKNHNILPSGDVFDASTNSYVQLTNSSIVTRKSNDGKIDLKGFSIDVNKNFTNVNFINLQTDTLKVNVYATDGKFAIGEEALVAVYPLKPNGVANSTALNKLSVLSNGNKTKQSGETLTGDTYSWGAYSVSFNENKGAVKVVLPSIRYQVKVSDVLKKQDKNAAYSATNSVQNTNQQIFFDRIPQTVFLGARDSITVTKTLITKCLPETDTQEVIKGKNGQDSVITVKACSKIKDTLNVQVKVIKPISPLNFVYHKDVEILWNDEKDGGTVASDLLLAGKNRLPANIINQWNAAQRGSSSLYLMTQGDQNALSFNIIEKYKIYDEDQYQSYYVDSALVEVYDQIGDIANKQSYNYAATTAQQKSKGFTYNLVPGVPNFSSLPFYDKSFQIYASVGVGGSTLRVSKLIYGMVQGEREEEGKGVTVTPNIPFMVLHRPPGDNSYAKLSKGSKFTWKNTTRYGTSGGAGVMTNLKFGSKTIASFNLESQLFFGRDNDGERGTETTMTISEEIQTSDNENNIGQRGDILFFNSKALSYGVYKKLRYTAPINASSGKIDSYSDAAFADNGIASTVMYTYAQVVDTEIPKLNKMIANNEIGIGVEKAKPAADATYIKSKQLENANLGAQINAYKNVIKQLDSVQNLAQNNKDKLKPFYKTMVQDEMAKYLNDSDADKKVKENLKNDNGDLYALQKNVTFSNGVDYTFTVENSMATIDNFAYEVYVDMDMSVYAHIGDNEMNYAEVGAVATLHSILDSKVVERSGEKTSSIEIHLADKNPGDYYSVDMLVDPIYNTPLFAVYGGASSCPWVPGTLKRDIPTIAVVGAQKQVNVPADQAATFTIQLGNESATDEGRQYNVKVNSRSNPYGAKLYLAGQEINNGVATFYVAPKDSARVTLEVRRGPLAYQYENLELYIGTTCENLETDNSDDLGSAIKSTKVSVAFVPSCGSVDLFKPGANWLVSSLNNNKLQVTFNKYDPNNPSMKWIGLEYRKKTGQNAGTIEEQWKEVVTIKPNQLQDAFYDYLFDVSSLADGDYELRAKSVCTDGYYFSAVYAGKIDRASLNVYGLPEPQDGILGIGKSLSVTYNSVLAASQPTLKIKLTRLDTNEEIPVTYTMNAAANAINIVSVNGDGVFDALENIELKAEVSGAIANNANVQADTIVWNFVVNRSSVYWSPRNIIVNAIENQQSPFSAKLINKTAKEQSFTLTKYASWLNPMLKSGKIVPFGELNLDFTVNKNLNTGIYQDTVYAEVNGKQQMLYVTVNVLRTPPSWTVDPQKYKYNMSFTAQFSIDQTDHLTSRDIRDKMALFVGKECRGIAQIEYDKTRDKYVAYITAYSNVAVGEEMTIHFWDTYPGLEYQAKERLSFIANGNLGNLVNPYILHPEGIYQTIPLKKGWTWISLNVQNNDMSLKNVLANLTPTEGDLIKTLSNNNAYSQYSKTMGWVGVLNDVNLYNSYMIYVAKADTIRILGNFISQVANVKLVKGWSWTGYPMAINMELNTYLKNFSPADGSQIVSQEEFAQYNAGTQSWSGSLKYLRPGKGYKFYTETDGFVIPVMPYVPTVDPLVETKQPITPPDNNPANPIIVNNNNTVVNSTVNNTSVNTVNYENNSSVTTIINQGGQTINNTTNRYETSVYVENKLVNIVNQTVLPNGQVVGFIPVNGSAADEGKVVQIKVYDKEEKKEYTAKIEQPVTQQTDLITGTVTAPVVLILEGLADVSVSNSLETNQVNRDEEFVYQLKVKNEGADLAVNVILSDTLATSFDYVGSDNVLVFDPVKRILKASILQLKSGETQLFNVRLRANKVGALTIGKGLVALNNDNNLANNNISPLALNVIDKRANSAKLLIPSLFTPNGDGINDRFEIVGLNEFYVTNNLVIFNKNYNEVYRRQNYQNDWTGDSLPMGSYGYILKVTDKDNKEMVYKGFITIIYQ